MFSSRTGILKCFCKNYAERHGRQAAIGAEFDVCSANGTAAAATETCEKVKMCEEIEWDFAVKYGAKYVASLGITVANKVCSWILRAVADRTVFPTVTDKSQIVLVAQFALSFLITGCGLVALYAHNIGLFVPLTDSDELGLLNLNRQWYNDVGCVVAITLLIRTLSAPLSGLCMWAYYRLRAQLATSMLYTERHTGPALCLDNSYSELLTYVFVGITFGSVVPAIYAEVSLALGVMYIQQKLQLMYLNQRPVSYSNHMGKTCLAFLPFSLLANLALTCVAVTDHELAGATRSHSAALMGVLALAAAVVVVRRLLTRREKNENEIVSEALPGFADVLSKPQAMELLGEYEAQKDCVWGLAYYTIEGTEVDSGIRGGDKAG